MKKLFTLLLSGIMLGPVVNSFAQDNYGHCLGNSCDAGIFAINILPLNAGWTTPPYNPDSLPEGEDVILSFNLHNYGDSVYYEPGVDYIRFGVTIANEYQDMKVMFNSMNDGYDYLFPDEMLFTTPNFTITLPNYKSFDVCIKAIIPNDVNSSNDELCKSFKTVGGVGVPSGINENKHRMISYVCFNNGYLSINFPNKDNFNQLHTTITDITGRTIDYKELNISGSENVIEIIPLPDLSKGIYLLSVHSDTQLIENRKFIVY